MSKAAPLKKSLLGVTGADTQLGRLLSGYSHSQDSMATTRCNKASLWPFQVLHWVKTLTGKEDKGATLAEATG